MLNNTLTEYILKETGRRMMGVSFTEQKYPYRTGCKATRWEQDVEWLATHIGDVAERWEYYRGYFWFVSEQDLIYYRLACQ